MKHTDNRLNANNSGSSTPDYGIIVDGVTDNSTISLLNNI